MSNWTDVAALADLFEGAGIAVEPEGHDIVLVDTTQHRSRAVDLI